MDDNVFDWRLQSDWYSPTRLHNSPVQYDFPGDRFIPNRSLMDLDQANGVLTNRVSPKHPQNPDSKIYRQKIENLKLSVEGRPFQMLVFRGSPKSSRKSNRLIDEMRRSDDKIPSYKPLRRFPKKESRILDAPNLKDDYYRNIMDWGKTNILAVALGSKLLLWHAENLKTEVLSEAMSEHDYPASVSWSEDGRRVAEGRRLSVIRLYDAETLKLIRLIDGHKGRVGCLAWNSGILTSGGEDGVILNHDVRARNGVACYYKAHANEVCGLKWSLTGNILASGGNDNLVYIWDARKMRSTHQLFKMNDHSAAVKALAWCPYNHNLLASGGGTGDFSIKIWNIQKETCINGINTKAQICALQWNRHHQEILSGHGYGTECQNRLCLWKYPSMSKMSESKMYRARVLHLSQSPDGVTVVSAVADETLRFWKAFGPVMDAKNSSTSRLDGLLSLKTSPMR